MLTQDIRIPWAGEAWLSKQADDGSSMELSRRERIRYVALWLACVTAAFACVKGAWAAEDSVSRTPSVRSDLTRQLAGADRAREINFLLARAHRPSPPR
jgi:hypothetical protein